MLSGIILNDLEWPWATYRNIQWYDLSNRPPRQEILH